MFKCFFSFKVYFTLKLSKKIVLVSTVELKHLQLSLISYVKYPLHNDEKVSNHLAKTCFYIPCDLYRDETFHCAQSLNELVCMD